MGEAATEKTNSPEKKVGKKSFFQGVKSEFKKIIWPDKKSVARQTVAVIAISVFLGALISVLDILIQYGLKFIA